MTDALAPEIELGHGLTLRSVRAPRGGLQLELSDAEDRLHRIDLRPADAGTPALQRVGELALSHRSEATDQEPPNAAEVLGHVAAWLTTLEVPARVALARWLDARPALGPWDVPRAPGLVDGRARRARPRSVLQPLAQAPTDRLRAWREDAGAAAEAGVQLAGVPRCFGGEPAPSELERPPECVRCLDRPECSGGSDVTPREALRPRLGDDALVDVLALLGALEQSDAAALEACAILRDAQQATPPGRSSWELSWKLHGEERVDDARAVLYRSGDDAHPALIAFAALAQAQPPALSTLLEVCDGLPCHVGFACHPEGRSAKLYVQVDQLPDGLRGKRAQTIVERLGATLPVVIRDRALYCIGLTMRPDGRRRVRAYEVVGRGALPGDALADAKGGRAWDVTPRGAPAPTAHFLHFEDAHLTAEDLRGRLTSYPPHLAWLAGGLSRSRARYYLNFIAHNKGGARTLYADVGPRPRSLSRG